jgi:hypothetical protein
VRLIGRFPNGCGVIFRRLSEKIVMGSFCSKLAPVQQETPRAQ